MHVQKFVTREDKTMQYKQIKCLRRLMQSSASQDHIPIETFLHVDTVFKSPQSNDL